MKDLTNILNILIITSILLAIASIVFYIRTNKINNMITKSISVGTTSNINLDYNKDIEFLNILIDEYTSNIAIMTKLKKINNINNAEFKNLVAETAISIDKRISERYRAKLYNYFSEDGFNDYINDKITMQMTLLTIKIIGQKN